MSGVCSCARVHHCLCECICQTACVCVCCVRACDVNVRMLRLTYWHVATMPKGKCYVRSGCNGIVLFVVVFSVFCEYRYSFVLMAYVIREKRNKYRVHWTLGIIFYLVAVGQ